MPKQDSVMGITLIRDVSSFIAVKVIQSRFDPVRIVSLYPLNSTRITFVCTDSIVICMNSIVTCTDSLHRELFVDWNCSLYEINLIDSIQQEDFEVCMYETLT